MAFHHDMRKGLKLHQQRQAEQEARSALPRRVQKIMTKGMAESRLVPGVFSKRLGKCLFKIDTLAGSKATRFERLRRQAEARRHKDEADADRPPHPLP